MTPTRRKPTRRTNAKKSIDGIADALFVDGARPEAAAVEARPEAVPAEARPAESAFASEDAAAKRAACAAEPKAPEPHEPAEPRVHAAYGAPAESRVHTARGETPHPGADDDRPLREERASHDEAEGPAPFKVVPGRRSSKPAASEDGAGKRRPSVVHLVLVAIVAVLIVVEGGFCLMRWAVNDALDMQGSWYVNGSASTIAITGESIVLAEDVAYEYRIDEGAKTISYSFGIMEGQGRYRFSLDRAQLAIIDGEYTFMDTLTSDIAWTFEALIAQIKGEPLAPGAGDNAMLLTRVEAPSPDGAPLAGEGAAGEGDAAAGSANDAAGVGDASADSSNVAADTAEPNTGNAAAGSSGSDDAPANTGSSGEDQQDSADPAQPNPEDAASSDDAQSGGKDTQFAGDVSDVPMINGGGHPLPVPKA